MEWNYIEYVRNFYKIERIVKSNWDKKEGKNKVSISVTVKLRLLNNAIEVHKTSSRI